MRWVVRFLLLLTTIVGFFMVAACLAQSVNPIPSPFNPIPRTASFFTDVVTWMTNEIYEENNEWMSPWVVQGCIAGAVPGLSHVPGSCAAYTKGYRVTETNSLTYPDASTCYVVVDPATSGNVTGISSAIFQRVGISHYVMNCDGSGAAGIVNEPMVMIVTTSGGAITNVIDVRHFGPIQAEAVLDPSPQSSTWSFPSTITSGSGETTVRSTTITTTAERTFLFAFATVQTQIEIPTVSFNQCLVLLKVDGQLVNGGTLTNASTQSYFQTITLVGASTISAGTHTITITVTSSGDPSNACENTGGRTVLTAF